MNTKNEILFFPLFYKDLDEIIDYFLFQLNNPSAAKNLLNLIYDEIEKRSYNPSSFEKYFSNKKRDKIYYKIYIKNYVIFYTINNNKMEIRRFLHNKRNFKKFLK